MARQTHYFFLSPVFSILSLPAPSQSWALILISNEMIALRFWFFLSPPSPQQLSWKLQCVCVWVCVFQSIPKAEQFITQTKPTGKRVLCCVCVLLPSVLSTHLYLHTSQPFHIFFPSVPKNVCHWSPDQPLSHQCYSEMDVLKLPGSQLQPSTLSCRRDHTLAQI